MGVGVSEVIGVGRTHVVGVRVVLYIVVEEEGGYTGTMWYSRPHVSVWGGGVVATTTRYPSPVVGGQPAHCAMSECGFCE